MPRKILIIGPAWVGDMIMAQSLFRLLKTKDPALLLDVLAPTWTFSLLSCMPEVSRAIELPLSHGELKLRQRYQLANTLRKENYAEAIVLPNSIKSALIPWLARIPKRTGWHGEGRYFLLTDRRSKKENRYALMVEQYLALGLPANHPLPAVYPYPILSVPEKTQRAVLDKHKPLWRGRPVLGLVAGAEFGSSKRWPVEYFATIANQKMAAGWDIWLFGSPKDRVITDKIMELTWHRCENLAGRLVLSETVALLSLVSGLVTNDSGLMHVGAALKKPLIAIYGSTSPAFTPPLSDTATVLQLKLDCQPCFKRACPLLHHHCMKQLEPAQVLSAIDRWG